MEFTCQYTLGGKFIILLLKKPKFLAAGIKESTRVCAIPFTSDVKCESDLGDVRRVENTQHSKYNER